ncbi:hypothetical protein F3157_13510 [Virgibacillus dakarensis]|uniref:Uncharacterized protein n=1 Tax=Lentibacillus populi TaxID=1827502 RepID=A0A9W5TUQ4_9BACI|nr:MULTISPECIES: hypothetical protein [Bacillaceae]MBT2216718.1 hypothetical protein [Virgibacillus dakarensis]MTW86669.1 hypothetical protein [Virgibacillus dakarensis]GGB29956.1 hypothetical protein GCM10011409_04100 [Lentibacillus populi]
MIRVQLGKGCLKLNGHTWTMDVIKEQDFIVDIVANVYTLTDITRLIEEYSARQE